MDSREDFVHHGEDVYGPTAFTEAAAQGVSSTVYGTLGLARAASHSIKPASYSYDGVE